ncbi:type III secretion system chaperone [Enterobacter hormaechei]|nr:type III secretion system chaperone [Enterobacter hormaechei]
MNCDDLITKYGIYVGIEGLSFDLNNTASLNINKHYLLTITKIDSNEALLNLCICPMHRDQAEYCALFLLNLNMSFINSSGAYLYWNEESSVICLSKAINSSVESEISLDDLIKSMVFDAKDIARKITEFLDK